MCESRGSTLNVNTDPRCVTELYIVHICPHLSLYGRYSNALIMVPRPGHPVRYITALVSRYGTIKPAYVVFQSANVTPMCFYGHRTLITWPHHSCRVTSLSPTMLNISGDFARTGKSHPRFISASTWYLPNDGIYCPRNTLCGDIEMHSLVRCWEWLLIIRQCELPFKISFSGQCQFISCRWISHVTAYHTAVIYHLSPENLHISWPDHTAPWWQRDRRVSDVRHRHAIWWK